MILYKRNAKGEPIQWSIKRVGNDVVISHGIVGKHIHNDVIPITMIKANEIESRTKAKRKEGYKALSELKDSTSPVEEMMDSTALLSYLDTYLPKYNTTDTGFVLPMLAKTLEDNKPFEKYGTMLGQWKINGLRCIISASSVNDLFSPVYFRYTSREGTEWQLPWFDERLIASISDELLDMMIEEGVCLDGELYIPGCSVNEINHYVKDSNSKRHRELQYWCYDICVPDMVFRAREELRQRSIGGRLLTRHLQNKNSIIVLPTYPISNITEAISYRDSFIGEGFEGLILRNPLAEYQFGKRNSAMFKFKKIDDGMFDVVDIKEDKRGLPIYTLRNDLNDELFECTINLPQAAQRNQLQMKSVLIGKKALVEFRERSGVKQVPFHAKIIKIYV